MPNRIIRESICTSETIDDLSFGAECTFYRLLVNVDDYGRIDARPKLLKSRLYPVRDMTETELCGYLDELYNSRLIWDYSVDGRRYIQVTKWNKYQQIRTKKSKFPAPDERQVCGCSEDVKFCNQMISDENHQTQNVALNPNPNPYPNPNPNPNPKSEERVCAREEPVGNPDTTPASLPPAAGHLGDEISPEEIEQEQAVQDQAEQYVRAYRLPINSRTLDAVASDIREKGADAVRAALDAATDSDTKGGISLRFYRACLNGGHGRRGRDAPGDMVRHSREEWERSSSAAIVDLDDE